MLFFAFIQPLALEARGLQYSGSTSQSHLQVQLKAIFITRFICLGALNDVAKPYVTFKMKQWRIARARHTQAARLAASFMEQQAEMDTYTPADLTNDYLDVLLPLCFVVFFGMISPVSVLLLLCVIMIQVRTDSWKLTHVYRRPYPQIARGIGVFNTFLEFCGHCMIFLNLGLIFVEFGGIRGMVPSSLDIRGDLDVAVVPATGPEGHEHTLSAGYLIDCLAFMVLTITLVLAWRLLGYMIPSVSAWVQLEHRRHDLQRHRLFYNAGVDGMKMRRVRLWQEDLKSRRDFGTSQRFSAEDQEMVI